MAGMGTSSQSTHQPHWGSFVESASSSVVGWLKQASLDVSDAVLSLTGRDMTADTTDTLVLIHYNDVYNIEQTTKTEPVGGALRFSTAIKQLQHLHPLVLFSGDAFSPSMLSTYTKGEQMVPVLNEVGTQCAVFGNHDFDFGLETLSSLKSACTFPWLMSNVIDRESGRPLGEGHITHAIIRGRRKIGLLGLVEHEWLDTLPTINAEEVTFLDFVEAGNKLGAQLKQEGCDYVIALTHMRRPNDIKLAEGCDQIDLILGGHDHVYEILQVNNRYIIKSGTDFRQFSKITLDFSSPGRVGVDCQKVDVTSDYAEDLELKAKTDIYSAMIESKMSTILGRFSVALDGRFSQIRRMETNLGNWVCDVLLAATDADLVIINAGTFRSDQVHEPGDFTLRDLSSILPMRDPLVVIEATGAVILTALENSVSKYPSLEGRFPQVAGITFAFDPSRPAGERVYSQTARVGDEYLEPEQTYRLCVKQYMYAGNDGFTMLPQCKVLVDDDLCPELGTAVQNHFTSIAVRTGRAKHSRHRQSLVTLSRRHSLVRLSSADVLPAPLRRASTADVHQHSRLTRRASIEDLEQRSCELAPRIDNRIVIIDSPEKLLELLDERARWEADSVIREVDENSPQ